MADTIIVHDLPANTPASFYGGGNNVTLDVYDNFAFSRTRKREEYTQLDKIQGAGVLGFDIPYTPKNIFLLQRFVAPNVLDNDYLPLRITALSGGEALPQTLLFVVRTDDAKRQFSIEISDSDEFWKKQAEALRLCDIDLGQYLFNKATIEAGWANTNWRTNGNIPVQVPPAHFGKIYNGIEGPFVITDWRPWISLPAILEAGFCQMNWTFESPLQENDWWCKLYLYILAKDFYKAPQKVDDYYFHATKLPTTYSWDDFTPPNQDQQNYFDAANGVYTNKNEDPIQLSFCFEAIYDTNCIGITPTQDYWIKWYLALRDPDDVVIEWYNGYQYLVPAGPQSLTFEFCTELIEIPPYWDVVLYSAIGPEFNSIAGLGPNDFQVAVCEGTTWEARLDGEMLYPGATIQVGNLLTCDKTFLDLLEGLAHFGLLFDTNHGERIVTMWPPETTDIHGSDVEGFLLDGSLAVALSDALEIVPESEKKELPRERTTRFIRYEFKDSKDDYIRIQKLPDDRPPFYRLVDLGPGLKNQLRRSRNKFFAATLNIEHALVTLPALWDNSDGRYSFDIDPRIIYFEGLVEQVNSLGEPIYFNYNSVTALGDNIPTSGQVITKLINDGSGVRKIEENIAYGYKRYDIYTMFLRYSQELQLAVPDIEYLMHINHALNRAMTFRVPLAIQYKHYAYMALLLEMNDYRAGTRLSTPVVVRPLAQRTDFPCATLCSYDIVAPNKYILDIVMEDGRNLRTLQVFSFPYDVTDPDQLTALQDELDAWLALEDSVANHTVAVSAGTSITITNTDQLFYSVVTNAVANLLGSTETLFNKVCN